MTDQDSKVPEGYFCPVCNAELARDLRNKLSEKLPPLSVLMMALEMLADSGCPGEYLRSVYQWSKRYGVTSDELSDNEKDKLALLKWKEWASR